MGNEIWLDIDDVEDTLNVNFIGPIHLRESNRHLVERTCGGYLIGRKGRGSNDGLFGVIYVGRARSSPTRGCDQGKSTLHHRFVDHANGDGKGSQCLAEYLNSTARNYLYYYYCETEDSCTAALFEARFMQYYDKPSCNLRWETERCCCQNKCATSNCPCRAEDYSCLAGCGCDPSICRNRD
jgi:hypothetical protein